MEIIILLLYDYTNVFIDINMSDTIYLLYIYRVFLALVISKKRNFFLFYDIFIFKI